MKAPISIVDETGELLIFKSIEAAEAYVEPIDVANGVYGSAYDAEGRLLNLVVIEPPQAGKGFLGLFGGGSFGRWSLQPAESKPTHMDELRERLVKELGKFGEPADWLRSASLEELLARGVEKYQTR